MKKEDWLEAFEAINGRKPSSEEFLSAKKNGEFLEVEDTEPVFEAFDDIDSESSFKTKKDDSKQIPKRSKVKSNLFSYLKYCMNHKKWGVLVYFGLFLILGVGFAGIPGIIVLLTSLYFLSKRGQRLVCKLAGAHRVERPDHQEIINRSVDRIITKARQQGLNLPDQIDIYLVQNDLPVAYAVGMNSIIVSESLLETPNFLESKLMFELNRIHNQSPNLLLLVVGANLFLIVTGLLLMLFGGFNKNYGDRRKSFWTGSSQASDGAFIYYCTLAAFMLLLSLTYFFVRSAVKRDIELSDRYVASLGLTQVHCIYLDKITKNDNSALKKFFEFGFPRKDSRVAMLQREAGVTNGR